MALCLALCILAFATACHAERGYLVIQVADIHNQPVAGIELATKGSSESGTTDRFGRTRIKLDSQIKVNDWVAMQIVRSPQGKDLVLISPWDAYAQVPPFDNETVNFLPLVVATRGDRALLENGKAVIAMAAQINKANSPKSKDVDPQQQRKEALQTIAKAFGLAPDDVDIAIRAWGERTSDPYEKGLTALYERNYPLASRELSQSLEMREKELAKVQAATADAAFFLGQSKFEEGKYRESVTAYLRALDLRPDDPPILNNLGLSLKEAGDYKRAETLCRRALEIDEKIHGLDDPSVGRDLDCLAEVLREKGDYKEAEPLMRRALAIDEKALGPDHPDVGRDLNDLADLLGVMGDYADTDALFQRAVKIHKKAFGSDHPDLGTDLNNRAALLYNKGDYSAAEPLYRQALAIHEKMLGEVHPLVATDMSNLAVLLKHKGEYAAAELLYRGALAIDENALEPNHPHVSRDLNNLAALLFIKKDYAAAEPLYRRALSIEEKALGPDHPDVAIQLANLANLLAAEGNYAGAEPLYRRALAIHERALGPDHPITRKIRENLASVLKKKNKAGQPR
jgi:tetratricopeptide (TPR) repeat protein